MRDRAAIKAIVTEPGQNRDDGADLAARLDYRRSQRRPLFPEPGQEIQYAEDLPLLPGQDEIAAALSRIWERPVRKRDANGIHGTIFYELGRYKAYYHAKREDGIEPSAVNHAQRKLFGIDSENPAGAESSLGHHIDHGAAGRPSWPV
jgi:hypothetical protein